MHISAEQGFRSLPWAAVDPTYMCTSPGIRHTLLGRFLSPAESATVRVHFVAGGTEAR
jgi:hypothetical protein